MTIYIGSSFSPKMLQNYQKNGNHKSYTVKFTPATLDEVNSVKKEAYSLMGHEETARKMGLMFNRETRRLTPDDTLYVVMVGHDRLNPDFKYNNEQLYFIKCEIIEETDC